MIILHKPTPQGVVTPYHKVLSFSFDPIEGRIHVYVQSFGTEEMTHLVWQDTYIMPEGFSASNIDAIELALVQVGQPFAGGSVILQAEATLATARVRRWAAVKDIAKAVAQGGFNTGLGRVQSDLASQAKINGFAVQAREAINMGQPWSIGFIMADNSVVLHNAQNMVDMQTLMMQHLDTCSAKSQALRAEIEAAETVEQVEAIDIETGWPGGE